MQLNVDAVIYIIPKKETSEYYNRIIKIDTIKEYSIESSWDDLADSGYVKLSRKLKNVTVYDSGDKFTFFPSNIESRVQDIEILALKLGVFKASIYNISSNTFFASNKTSIINRGDFIFIVPKYSYYNDKNNWTTTDFNIGQNSISLNATNDRETSFEIEINKQQGKNYDEIESFSNAPRSQIFVGYITEIKSGFDIEIKIQDYMYFFQNLPISDKLFLSTKWNVIADGKGRKSMIEYLLIDASKLYQANQEEKLYPIWTDDKIDTFSIRNFQIGDKPSGINYLTDQNNQIDAQVGDITCENATFGMFLKEIKDRYGMKPFFYPNSNWLNILPFKYNSEAISLKNQMGYEAFIFEFQKNIISSNLYYRKREDIIAGAIVKTIYKVEKKVGIGGEVIKTKTGKTKTRTKPKAVFVGQKGGTIFTFLYNREVDRPKTKAEENELDKILKTFGEEQLQQNIYTGYYGSFTTFGYPYVRHGDIVQIKDNIYPERNGFYRVKKVRSYGGSNVGLRQEITIDIKYDVQKITNQ